MGWRGVDDALNKSGVRKLSVVYINVHFKAWLVFIVIYRFQRLAQGHLSSWRFRSLIHSFIHSFIHLFICLLIWSCTSFVPTALTVRVCSPSWTSCWRVLRCFQQCSDQRNQLSFGRLQSGWSTGVKRNHLFNPTSDKILSELGSEQNLMRLQVFIPPEVLDLHRLSPLELLWLKPLRF